MDHKLPNGQWIFFGNVAYEATAEDVQKFLAEAGITVGLDHIRMNNREGYRASAVISLPSSEIATLVERAIGPNPFMGRELRISYANASR